MDFGTSEPWSPGQPFPWWGEKEWDLNNLFCTELGKRKAEESLGGSRSKKGRPASKRSVSAPGPLPHLSPREQQGNLQRSLLESLHLESQRRLAGVGPSGAPPLIIEDDSDREASRTPKRESGAGVGPFSHPLNIPPSQLSRAEVYAQHPGLFVRHGEIPVHRGFDPQVLEAIAASGVASAFMSEFVFKGHKTEAQRKHANHALLRGVMAPFRSLLRVEVLERVDENNEDQAAGGSPFSTRALFAKGEDAAEQVQARSSDTCFFREVKETLPGALPGTQSELPFLTSEEKSESRFQNFLFDNPERKEEGLAQGLGYAAPSAARMALDSRVRELDYGLYGTSAEQWMPTVLRVLAMVTLRDAEEPRLEAFEGRKEGAAGRLREAREYYYKEFCRRLSVFEAQFNVKYKGTFLIYEVIVGPTCGLLRFPLRNTQRDEVIRFVEYFLTYACGPRAADFNAKSIHKNVWGFVEDAFAEATVVMNGRYEEKFAGNYPQLLREAKLAMRRSLEGSEGSRPWWSLDVSELAIDALGRERERKRARIGGESSSSGPGVQEIADQAILDLYASRKKLVGRDEGDDSQLTDYFNLALRLIKSKEREAALQLLRKALDEAE